MIARGFAILTVLFCCVATLAADRQTRPQTVIVIGNHTQREVSFTLQTGRGKTKPYRMPVDGVIAAPLSGNLELAFTIDGVERKYALDANSAYFFAQFPFGIDLEKATFAAPKEFIPPAVASHRGPRPGPRRIAGKTEPTDTIQVKILLDENPVLARERWQSIVKKRFEAAAALVEAACGLKLQIASIEAWQPPAAGGAPAVEKSLQAVPLGDAWLVLGIVSNQAGGVRIDAHPVPTPLSTHVLLGELSAPAGEAEKTAQLTHLLGHYLGAGESPEPASIMHTDHAGLRARDAQANRAFDAANTLAMRLLAADVGQHGLRDWGELDDQTLGQIRGIQATLAQALPAQFAARQVGRGFDRGRRWRDRDSRESQRPAEMPFSAALVDGTMLTGALVRGWGDNHTDPSVDRYLIFDRERPVRWLRNDDLVQQASVPAYIEFVGGDRLPGTIVRYEPAGESDSGPTPAHLLIAPSEPLFWRDQQEQLRPIRVQVSAIQRIVCQSHDERYQPGTAFMRGGGRTKFRSVRFAADGIRLFVEGEIKPVAFSELAELHLPQSDVWNSYFEQLACLAPALSERLIQLETSDGLIATTSAARLRAQTTGGDSRTWMHVVQPAWSLDPLWLRHRTVVMRRFFDPSEIALSMIQPTATSRKAFFSSAWDWQINRNAQLGPLRCGGREFAWGIGTHAYSQLEYELPAAAETFRCQVGLDHVAGSGGCARAVIYAASTKTKPLYRSDLLIGSTRSFDTGALPLKRRKNENPRLVLVAHPAHKERPSGADPLDVRDSIDWLEPIITCNRAALSNAIHGVAPALVPAWAGWKLDAESSVTLVSLWDKTDSADPRFRVEALPVGDTLALSRTYHIRSASSHLEIGASRFGAGVTPSKIEIFADGQLLDDFKVLVDNPRNPQSHLHSIPLGDFVGRDVELRIVQHCEGQASSVCWRRLTLVE